MQPYDWKVTAYKALKAGLVTSVAFIVADPSLMPAILQAVPENLRMVAVIVLPMLWASIGNWLKHQQTGF